MVDWPLLSILLIIPLVGAIFVFCIRGESEIVSQNAKNVALWTSIITFFLSLILWVQFDSSTAAYQFEEKAPWFADGITYHLGVDGISVLFILLTTLLTPICILASWESINFRVKEYMISFLIMETYMLFDNFNKIASF